MLKNNKSKLKNYLYFCNSYLIYMQNKIHSLDYIRVVAIFMILLCHYFMFSDLNTGVGRYFAGVGNMIFFLVSAMLYGTKHVDGGISVEYKRFIAGRVIKLGIPTWTFLTILIVLLLVFGVRFSWNDALLNYLFLGYLGKLPGNGHLWFLTVIMACYAEMLLLLRFEANKKYTPWIILIVSIIMLIAGEGLGIPSIALLTLGLFGFVFMKSSWLLQKSKSMTWWMSILIIALNVWCFYLEYNGLFVKSRSMHFLLTSICGVSLLSMMLRFIPNNSNRLVSLICGISFEIYLVHHTLCAGPFVAITHWPFNHVIDFVILVIASIIFATLLKILSFRTMRR